eukprot:TRINITY_DN1437_c1_g2_i1.p1 TRINITY_DN1437_c1_g2~~TRINITY_DN1437_c1_g2_i1.p1  ORF type:complete len:794 (-),score=204.08 TRINITY_DN1437_c1_g2_i1:87-2468(-)
MSYSSFWAGMRNKQFATYYVVALIARMAEIDQGLDGAALVQHVRQIANGEELKPAGKPGLQIDEASPEAYQKQSILNTLYFIASFYDIDMQSPLFTRALPHWNGAPDPLRPNAYVSPFCQEIIRLFKADFLEQKEAIITLIEQCTNLDAHKGLATMPVLDLRTAKPFAMSVSFPSLRMALAHGKQTNLIFETISLFLKHPLITSGRLLSLLHVVRGFVTLTPGLDRAQITTLIAMIKPYFLWPLPYGTVAKDVLLFLHRELRDPGAAFRAALAAEHPQLFSKTPHGEERRVHLLINRQSSNAKNFQDLISSVTPDDTPPEFLLAQLLSAAFESYTPLLSLNDLNLFSRSLEQLEKHHKKAMAIFSEAERKPEGAEREDTIVQQLRLLYATIKQETPARPDLPQPPSYLRHQLPALQYDYVNLKNEKMETLETLTSIALPHLSLMDTMESVCRAALRECGPGVKPVVRFAVCGGDGTLHATVCSYVALRQATPELFGAVQMEFFVIPLGRENCFAQFLATYDPWYGRNVLGAVQNVMRTLPAMSGQVSKAIEKKMGIKHDTGGVWTSSETFLDSTAINEPPVVIPGLPPPPHPATMLRDQLDLYFRDARQTFPLALFQCQCWPVEGAFRTIPFCQRVEIGFPVQKYRAELENKGKEKVKAMMVDLSIKLSHMNCMGMARQASPLESRSYAAISIASTPRGGERGPLGNPTLPWLEVAATEDPGKKKSKKPGDLFGQNYHVGFIELKEDKKKPFEILIDGEIFGPFWRIHISACKANDSSEHLSIPIMSYFPCEF